MSMSGVPSLRPFDEDKAWRSLTGFARFYFGRGSENQANHRLRIASNACAILQRFYAEPAGW